MILEICDSHIATIDSINPLCVHEKPLIWIGIVVLVLGLLAGTIKTNQEQAFGLFTTTATPYAPYTVPLLLVGIVLIIVGIFVGRKE